MEKEKALNIVNIILEKIEEPDCILSHNTIRFDKKTFRIMGTGKQRLVIHDSENEFADIDLLEQEAKDLQRAIVAKQKLLNTTDTEAIMNSWLDKHRIKL